MGSAGVGLWQEFLSHYCEGTYASGTAQAHHP